MSKALTVLLLAFHCLQALGQDGMAFQEQFRLTVDRSKEKIRIDGVLTCPAFLARKI